MQALIFIYRPRKFSFDPKAKKLFHCSEEESWDSPLSKVYFNGKLVDKDEVSSASGDTLHSEEPTLLSFLKWELCSEQDPQCNFDDNMFEIDDEAQSYIKTDEEKASSPLWDPKMGPIFKLFQMSE